MPDVTQDNPETNSSPTISPLLSEAPGDAPPKPGRSTGPRTEQGKAKSSMNRLNHGLRSEKAVLPDEDPAEYEATIQAWLDIYNPRDRKEDELVHELALAHWQLKRARKRLEDIEFSLPSNAWDWNDVHQKQFANFTRYKTTAERSFNRWFKDMEAHRGRQFKEDQIRETARIAAAAVEVKWLTPREAEAAKKMKANQIVEVEIVNGKTFTSLYPSNQELFELYSSFPTPPIFVKRYLIFLDGIPEEYGWCDPQHLQTSDHPQAVQNMLWPRWLKLIDREKALDSKHVGPMF